MAIPALIVIVIVYSAITCNISRLLKETETSLSSLSRDAKLRGKELGEVSVTSSILSLFQFAVDTAAITLFSVIAITQVSTEAVTQWLGVWVAAIALTFVINWRWWHRSHQTYAAIRQWIDEERRK